MSASIIAFIILALMLSGMALGSYLRLVLPDEHTQTDSKDILMTATDMMAKLIALIIGLLVTSAKGTYDDTNSSIMQTRWMLIEQSQTKLPRMFLVVLTFWFTVLFVQFGLLAPRNWTALWAVFICVLSMAGAIFLVLELNHPLEGRIKISSAPMQKALSLIGK